MPTEIHVQEDGKVLISGQLLSKFFGPYYIMRINSDGTPDNSFGVKGVLNISQIMESEFSGMYWATLSVTLMPDGKIIVTGSTTELNKPPKYYLARLTSGGKIDPTFQNKGFMLFTHPDRLTLLTGLKRYDKSNEETFLYTFGITDKAGRATPFISRCKSNGDLDTQFGEQGFMDSPTQQSTECRDIDISLDGAKLTTCGWTQGIYEDSTMLSKGLDTGAIDFSFNNGNPVFGVFDDFDGFSYNSSVAVKSQHGRDEKVLLFANCGYEPQAVIARYDKFGELDTTFGGGVGFGKVEGGSFFTNATSCLPDGGRRVLCAGRHNGTAAVMAILL